MIFDFVVLTSSGVKQILFGEKLFIYSYNSQISMRWNKLCMQEFTKGTYLIYIYRLLFGLYSLHLDVLTELYCLLLCFHCRYTSNTTKIHISNQLNIHKRSK